MVLFLSLMRIQARPVSQNLVLRSPASQSAILQISSQSQTSVAGPSLINIIPTYSKHADTSLTNLSLAKLGLPKGTLIYLRYSDLSLEGLGLVNLRSNYRFMSSNFWSYRVLQAPVIQI